MQTFIENILSPAVILDKTSSVLFANKKAKELFLPDFSFERIKNSLKPFHQKECAAQNSFPLEIKGQRIENLPGLYNLHFFPVATYENDDGAMVLISKSSAKESKDKLLHELELINRVITNVTSSLEMDVVLNAIFSQLMNEYRFDGMCIQLKGDDDIIRTVKIYYEGANNDELEELKNMAYPLESANFSIKGVLLNAKHYIDENTLYLPLIVQNKIIGLLSVSHFKEGLSLDEEDINSVKRHADYISVAINNSNLYNQIKKVNKKLEEKDKIISSDLMLAKRIQQNVLGTKIKPHKNLDIFSDYIPYMEVGGDYYDICEPDDRTVRIFIADATGHGVPAGLITMLIKSEYEKLKYLKENPSLILEKINKIFATSYLDTGVFLTGFILDIDIDAKTISYSSAGHPPVILIRQDEIIKLATKGSLIGLLETSSYTDGKNKIQDGDKILLYTDGIFEEFNEKDEIFGEERLYEIISLNAGLPLNEIKEALIKKVKSFSSKNSFEDDVTLIGITYKK